VQNVSLQNIQSGSGAKPLCYAKGTQDKAAEGGGGAADYSSPIGNEAIYTLSRIPSWHAKGEIFLPFLVYQETYSVILLVGLRKAKQTADTVT
jgi:hypothetical protein